MNIILLDRDGVINRDRNASVQSIDEFEVLPNAKKAFGVLATADVEVIVVTNQAVVGRGELEREELHRIHEKMKKIAEDEGCEILDVVSCTHADEENCSCRKPEPGLIEEAHQKYGFERSETWMVGDDRRDIEAATAGGCKPAVVRTGKGDQWEPDDGVPVYKDLLDFVRKEIN
jgi:D-glycero-D-manno-heptose 1,7-bisphosphate phosphatase